MKRTPDEWWKFAYESKREARGLVAQEMCDGVMELAMLLKDKPAAKPEKEVSIEKPEPVAKDLNKYWREKQRKWREQRAKQKAKEG